MREFLRTGRRGLHVPGVAATEGDVMDGARSLVTMALAGVDICACCHPRLEVRPLELLDPCVPGIAGAGPGTRGPLG